MSVHSLGLRLVAQPPERICSKLVLQVPGVCNQPHLIFKSAGPVRQRTPRRFRAPPTSGEYIKVPHFVKCE